MWTPEEKKQRIDELLEFLNNELISEKSYPFILDNKTQKKLVEIDTPENYKKWISIKNNI